MVGRHRLSGDDSVFFSLVVEGYSTERNQEG